MYESVAILINWVNKLMNLNIVHITKNLFKYFELGLFNCYTKPFAEILKLDCFIVYLISIFITCFLILLSLMNFLIFYLRFVFQVSWKFIFFHFLKIITIWILITIRRINFINCVLNFLKILSFSVFASKNSTSVLTFLKNNLIINGFESEFCFNI